MDKFFYCVNSLIDGFVLGMTIGIIFLILLALCVAGILLYGIGVI